MMRSVFKQNAWTESEIDTFITQLKHAIVWTGQLSEYFDFENGNYETVFRKTNPVIRGLPLYNFDKSEMEWNHDNYDRELYRELLKIVTSTRASHTEVDLRNLDALGRILSFETCVSTHDGASLEATHGFIDIGDVPPIDTWFFLKDNYTHNHSTCKQALFCWIPKPFEVMMQSAIDVEMLASYQWLHRNDTFLDHRLKNT